MPSEADLDLEMESGCRRLVRQSVQAALIAASAFRPPGTSGQAEPVHSNRRRHPNVSSVRRDASGLAVLRADYILGLTEFLEDAQSDR
jgi:hypothetical protein